MTKKILIATRNLSKLKLVSSLMKVCGFENYDFYSLKDLKYDIPDEKEIGTVAERAKQKCLNALNNLKNNDYDFILGIDDVFEIHGRIETEVKKIILDILGDKLLKDGEIATVCRGYHFISKDGKEYNFITRIPLKYKKYQGDINSITDKGYPLNAVFFFLDESKQDKPNEYYKPYCIEFFDKIEK